MNIICEDMLQKVSKFFSIRSIKQGEKKRLTDVIFYSEF